MKAKQFVIPDVTPDDIKQFGDIVAEVEVDDPPIPGSITRNLRELLEPRADGVTW